MKLELTSRRLRYPLNMVMLHDTELYADIRELEEVSIGDTVHCRHSKLDIVTDARVIELEWDCDQ